MEWFKPALRILTMLLIVGSAGLEAAALDVTVRPDKLCVKPAEKVRIDVQVLGMPTGQTAAVECRIETGLGKEVARFSSTTAADGRAAFTFVPKAEWGYTTVATVTAGGATAMAWDVFACARNPYMVAPDYDCLNAFGVDSLPDGSPAPDGRWPVSAGAQQLIGSLVESYRYRYIPVGEFFGMASCAFSSIKPPVPNYFNAYHYNYSANTVRGLIDRFHANGLASVIYVNSCLTGLAGTEFARRHPEYLAYTPDGMPFCGGIATKPIAIHQWYVKNYPASFKEVMGMLKQTPQPQAVQYGGGNPDNNGLASLRANYPGFLNASLDFSDPRVAEIGAEKIIAGQDYFGFDGVRYDGEYRVPSVGDPLAPSCDVRNYKGERQKTGKAAEAMTARILSRAFGMMEKHDPNFLIGLNCADFRTDVRGDKVLHSPWLAAIGQGRYILDEQAKSATDPSHPDHRWTDFVNNMSDETERVREAGEYLFAGWSSGLTVPETKQIKAVSWACGFRWLGFGDEKLPAVEHIYNRFALRYGQYFLDNRLERIPVAVAARSIQVTASRPFLRWERLAHRLDTADGRYLILHLINQPLEPNLVIGAQAPPPATNVRVTIDKEIIGGAPVALDQIRVLSPDVEPDRQPVRAELAGDKIVVPVPDVQVWTILVIPY